MAKTIMIVDDDFVMQQTVQAVLESAGFKVISENSGEDALETLKTQKPDLLLVDMMMPDMDGKELVTRIRAKPSFKDLKIIYLTVMHKLAIGKKELEDLRVSDYINKPFDNKDLIARVKKAVGE